MYLLDELEAVKNQRKNELALIGKLKDELPESHWVFRYLSDKNISLKTVQDARLSPILEVQRALVSKDSLVVNLLLVENPALHEEIQLLLYDRNDYEINYHLARTACLFPKVQELLARDADIDTRIIFARSGKLNLAAQLILAKDEILDVQKHLAINMNLTITEDFPVSFLLRYKKQFMDECLAKLPKDQLELALSLSVHYEGSLKSLLEMVRLV